MTNYPTTIDSYTRPGALDPMNTTPVKGTEVIANLYDSVEAIEAVVGVTGSAVATSVIYKLTNVLSLDPGHKHTLASITDVTASASELNILTGATLSTLELNLLDGLTATTAELNKLASIGAGAITTDSNVQVFTNKSLTEAQVVFSGTGHGHTGGTDGNTIGTTGIEADAITDAKLIFGKLRDRQGGSATDWDSQGTNNYDYSATNVFQQMGSRLIDSSAKIITFPRAFAQKPLVFVSVTSAGSANVWARAKDVTTTQFEVACLDAAGVSVTTERISWLALGE
jgi:hypothetical protein